MADSKLSELTAATTLDSADELYTNDDGESKRITLEDLAKIIFSIGASGGRTINGGTDENDNLNINSNSSINKGVIYLDALMNVDSNENVVTIDGNLNIDSIILDLQQDYIFTGRGNAIAFAGLSDASTAQYEFFTKDGDGSSDISLILYGVGTRSSVINRERLNIKYDQSDDQYQIFTDNAGSGSAKPLRLNTPGDTNQLYLDENGNVGVGKNSTKAKLDVNGNIKLNTTSITSTSTADLSNHVNFIDATSGDVTLTLPTAVANEGVVINCKRNDSSVNSVTIDTTSSQTIDADLTVTLSQWENLTLISNGSNWLII